MQNNSVNNTQIKSYWKIWVSFGVVVLCLFGFNIKLLFLIKEFNISMKSEMGDAAKRLSNIERVVNNNISQISGVSDDISKINTDLGTMHLRIEASNAKIDATITKLSTTEELLNRNANKINTFLGNFNQLKRDLENVNIAIKENADKLVQLDTASAALQKKVESLAVPAVEVEKLK